MPKTVIQISDSPLAQAMRQAIETAYHDDRGITLSLALNSGPGATPVTLVAEALVKFTRENGLDGHVTQSGRREPFRVEFPKDTGHILFHIG